MAPNAVLELRDTEPERPVLRIAGEDYHFALKSDLSMEQLAQAQAIGAQMQGLGADPSPEQVVEVARRLRDVVRIATHDLPDEVVKSLTDGECIAIVEAFMRTLPTEASPVASSQTTAPSSPTTTASIQNAS